MTKKPKKQDFKNGDIFFIPLTDGSQCVGQVLKITKSALNSCICAFFDIRLPSVVKNIERVLADELVTSVQFVTPDLLKEGYWPICENRQIVIDVEQYMPLMSLEATGYVGASIVGSGNIQEFLNAYYGLCPWDEWHDPKYLDKLLVDGKKRPANVILTKI